MRVDGVGLFGLSRRGERAAVTFLVAALVASILLFAFRGKSTPSAAGLRQIPAAALTELKSRLHADGRRYPSYSPGTVGTITRSLTGAVLLSSGPGSLRFEVSTQYYFRLRDKPPAGPDHWLGESDEYSVRLVRTADRPWQVASIRLVPPPHVQGQG